MSPTFSHRAGGNAMFQNLRLKLTIINSAIILALFLMLTVGSYCFFRVDMGRRTDFVARMIAGDIQSGRITDLPLRKNGFPRPPGEPQPGPPSDHPPGPPLERPPGGDFFFVRTSPDGTVTFRSSGQPLDAAELTGLTEKALQDDKMQGTVNYNQTDYRYLKAPLTNQPGMLVLFHDSSRESGMLGGLLTAMTGVGLLCALLSFGASFFMANRAMVPIQKAWQQQKDFLSDASHELRTPLTVIRTNLDVVRGSPEETVASQANWLDNIQEETKAMAKLIDELLFLARADSQQQPLVKDIFALNATVAQVVAAFEPVAAAKGVLLEAPGPLLPVDCHGDEARIRQLLGILLDNAIRHTPPTGKVSVYLSQANAKILLSVADTGEGIEPRHLDRIFDRFYQVNKARSNGSAGLGLAIAKWIAGSHGGAITAASRPGEGTIFTVELPGGDSGKKFPFR
jgi:signal transduction histidine kinase